jgi:Flp pilus assembly protein TadG
LILGRDEIKLRKQRGGEKGQTLIVVLFAMPLLIAVIALVADGSNLFANKRSVQNAADAAVFAVAQDLPTDGSICAAACLTTLQSHANEYSKTRNSGPGVDHACANSSDTNCYVTPVPGKGNSSAQIRLRKSVTTFIAGFFGLSTSSVSAKAAVSLGGAPNAVGNVAPIGITKKYWDNCNAAPPCFNVSVKLDFDDTGVGSYALLDLKDVSTTGPTPGGNAQPPDMKIWLSTGYPGFLPANAWYGDNNGQKNGGFKQVLQDDYTNQVVLLIPVFDKLCPTATAPTPPECPTPGTPPASYHVVGFSAFVIDQPPPNWNSSGNNHFLMGHFVTFIAKGVSGGPPGGPNDFGVHVIQLDE